MIDKSHQHQILISYLSSKEKTADVNILINEVINQNDASKLKILFLTHLVSHGASAFDFQEKWTNGNHLKAVFFSQELKTELKNLVSINIEIFNHKETDVSKIRGNWELISIFFQKLSWCTTTTPNILFLPYLYPEIWTAGKNDPQA